MRTSLLIVSLLFLAPPSTVALQAAGQSSPAQLKKSVLSVSGMSCSSCATGIKAMLKRTAGVQSADVSYEKKEAVISYDASRTTETKLIEVISKLGYKVKAKKA